MIGICGNPLCLCRDVAPASTQEWTPYTEAESAALGEAVREFAEKHGIPLGGDFEDVDPVTELTHQASYHLRGES